MLFDILYAAFILFGTCQKDYAVLKVLWWNSGNLSGELWGVRNHELDTVSLHKLLTKHGKMWLFMLSWIKICGFYGHFDLSWKQLNSSWSSTMYVCPLWSNTCRTWLPEKKLKKKKSFQESIEKDAQEHFGSTYLEKSMCLGNGMSSSMRQGVFFCEILREALNCTVWSLLMQTGHSKRWFYWNSACSFWSVFVAIQSERPAT